MGGALPRADRGAAELPGVEREDGERLTVRRAGSRPPEAAAPTKASASRRRSSTEVSAPIDEAFLSPEKGGTSNGWTLGGTAAAAPPDPNGTWLVLPCGDPRVVGALIPGAADSGGTLRLVAAGGSGNVLGSSMIFSSGFSPLTRFRVPTETCFGHVHDRVPRGGLRRETRLAYYRTTVPSTCECIWGESSTSVATWRQAVTTGHAPSPTMRARKRRALAMP